MESSIGRFTILSKDDFEPQLASTSSKSKSKSLAPFSVQMPGPSAAQGAGLGQDTLVKDFGCYIFLVRADRIVLI